LINLAISFIDEGKAFENIVTIRADDFSIKFKNKPIYNNNIWTIFFWFKLLLL